MHSLGEGHIRVSLCFDDESQRKNDAIAALKEEVSALKSQLSQKKQGDPDVTHRLLCLSFSSQYAASDKGPCHLARIQSSIPYLHFPTG